MERSTVSLAGEKKEKSILIMLTTHRDITDRSTTTRTIFGIWRHQQLLGLLVACLGSSFVVFCSCSHIPLHTKATLITLTQEEQSSVILQACTTIKDSEIDSTKGDHIWFTISF